MKLGRARVSALALVLVAVVLTGCDEGSTVSRPLQPAVLTGADLPELVGEAPGSIVAFKHHRPAGEARWVQIPVQVDERAVVAFGTRPSDNSTPGATGTVYGNGSGGPTALQYTDPNTFVGADPDPTFDADDELVFMISDAGGQPRPTDPTEPAGVVSGSGVAVLVEDPQTPGKSGWVYLFVSDGSLEPSAGISYVDYDFQLTSGDYKTTYRRAEGPNPETSSVTTDSYRIEYTDRWFEVDWRVGDGPNLIDGHKNSFTIGYCGRSNATFANAWGAFVANVDGPVRAIRSYVGANSGPATQRTHFMYRQHEVIVTDLRVHSIPAILDYIDYSTDAVGMTYRSSTTPEGVTVDGLPDEVSTDVADWEAVHGEQGTVVTTNRLDTDVPDLSLKWFYWDQSNWPGNHCWGDSAFIGASGSSIEGGIANTDPATPPHYDLKGTRMVAFLPPTENGEAVTAIAEALAADVDEPVVLSVDSYQP